MINKKNVIIIVSIVLLVALAAGPLYLFFDYIPYQREKEERIAVMKAYYDEKLALYKRENEEYADYEVDVAFIGDSLTDGYDVERFYFEYKVENRGIGGETTYGLLARLDVSVYDLKPRVIVMLIGANNMKTMLDDYEQLIIDIERNLPETKLIICSLTSMGREWGKNNHLAAYNNVIIKELSLKHSCIFVDLYTPLLNIETGEIFERYTTDGGHLTEEGYVVLTENIKPAIAEALSE